ncbi:anaerobic ribonucleoside-triphosphate reductase activating protein [Pleomorphochaeta sp. DL1XJH-081]|uniref:anaerobic ribonucleoside-triphosphate reductase activating protein n=1 Tax=Pleomorphochaeta sp. DL1XJH-081 TaxID=3409690 RepID=UPI003BB52361
MKIAGVLGSSLIDYPGHIACVVFLQGCNWNCTYCHNKALIPLQAAENSVSYPTQGLGEPLSTSDSDGGMLRSRERSHIDFPEQLYAYLETRRGLLDGVVVTGGEPTIHAGLQILLEEIRSMDFSVKLDTNGSNPRMLTQLLDAGCVDYVAMDIKAPWYKYSEICGPHADAARVKESLGILQHSAIAWEARTTLCPELDEDDVAWLEELGYFR